MRKSLLLLTATALLAASPAADLDRNGEVTRAEFMAVADARFTAADGDFDGQLTRDEMRALHEATRAEHAKEHFARMDANGDGVVSEAEMLAAQDQRKKRKSDRRDNRRERMMKRFDTDGDGTLSDAEKAEAREAAKQNRTERKGKRKERGAKRPRLDADRDGLVSRTEYDTMTTALFDRMDADGNGILTKGEGQKRRGRPTPPSHGGR